MKTETKSKPSRNKINWLVDIAAFILFLIVSAPQATGQALHEWLSIAIAATIVVHLLLHWDWIIQVSRRFFGKLPRKTRINYTVNFLLAIAMTVVVFSGLVTSEVALPFLGLTVTIDSFWVFMHEISANLVLLLLGVHLALHWDWIKRAFNRYVVAALRQPQATAVQRQVGP